MPIIRTPDVLLGTLERGQLVQDFQTSIDEVLAKLAVLGERGKAKGSVALKIDFTVEDSVTEIKAAIIAKTPQADRPKTVLFVTPDGRLSTDHPKQIDMFAGPRDVATRAL
jgi:hypothetical protein